MINHNLGSFATAGQTHRRALFGWGEGAVQEGFPPIEFPLCIQDSQESGQDPLPSVRHFF